MAKKEQKRERMKQLLHFQRIKMAKEFGEACCPVVTNANIRSLHLSRCPYVDIGRGKLLLLLFYSVEVSIEPALWYLIA